MKSVIEIKNISHPVITTPSIIELNKVIFILVSQGHATLYIDLIETKIQTDNLIILLPGQEIHSVYTSPDFRAYLIISESSLLKNIQTIEKNSSQLNYMSIRKNPLIPLTTPEATCIKKCIIDTIETTTKKNHFYRQELIRNKFTTFLLELFHILETSGKIHDSPVYSRKEEIINKFIELLHLHYRKHHTVSFYAEKLCVTPQYLSLVLKNTTGKTANKWINETLLDDAKSLLTSSQNTIQQIADILHFADQSTFGKFFRKHMQISPTTFRRSYLA